MNAMLEAANSAVPSLPTRIRNTVNASASRNQCKPLGTPKRSKRPNNAQSGRQPDSVAQRSRCVWRSISAIPTTAEAVAMAPRPARSPARRATWRASASEIIAVWKRPWRFSTTARSVRKRA